MKLVAAAAALIAATLMAGALPAESGQRNRSELVGALGEQLFNFVRRHPDG